MKTARISTSPPNRRPEKSRWCGAIMLCLLLASLPAAMGATRTWDGSSSANWSTAANWSGGVAPVAGDDLVFPAGVTRLLVTNNLAAGTVFNSITFRGSNYSVTGNALNLTGGVRGEQTTNINRVHLDITLAAPQTFECTNANGLVEFTGLISLGTNTLTIGGSGDLDFSGRITGSGGVTKIGSGQATYRGPSDNTYTGTTFVRAGTLSLSKNFAINSLAGPLIVGDSFDSLFQTDTVIVASQDTIPGIEVTVNFRGYIDMRRTAFVDALHINGGRIDVDPDLATLIIASEFTGTSGLLGNSIINGDVQMGSAGGPFTINIANGTGSPDLVINGTLTGRNGGIVNLTKLGAGELELQTTNHYRGTTTVAAGTLTAADGRALGTNTVSVNGGASLKITEAVVTNRSLVLRGAGVGGGGVLIGSGVSSAWTGPVELATDSVIHVVNGAALELSGAISGTGGLFKEGAGTLVFSGTNANSYAGSTEVRAGILELNRSGVFALPSTPLVIGDDADGTATDRVRYLANNQLSVNTTITINRTGVLDLNNRNDDLGTISLTGGTLQTGTGTATMLRTWSATSVQTGTFPTFDRDEARITGNLSLGANPRTFTVTRNPLFPPGSDLILSAIISGTPGWTKSGTGVMEITGANTYAGTTTVNGGTLVVRNSSALGSTATGTTVNNDAGLELPGGVSVADEPLTLNSTLAGSGVIYAYGASNFWGGDITFARTAVIGVENGVALNLGGTLAGPGGFEKDDLGRLVLSGNTSNTYGGLTFVREGSLFCNKSSTEFSIPGDIVIGDGTGTNVDLVFYSLGQINNQSRVTVASTGRLQLGTDTIGSLSGSGVVEIFNTGELRTGANNESTTFDGLITGGGGLAKRGTGVFTLSGDNTYTGATVIEAGTLVVNGSQAGSAVTVRTNATLAGTGRVGALQAANGAAVRPGTSPGRLSASSLVLSNDSTLFIELAGTQPGTGFDQLLALAAPNVAGARLVIAREPTFIPAVNQTFVILTNASAAPVTGSFDGLPQNGTTTVDGMVYRISYTGGNGNDVTLTRLAPPVAQSLVPFGATWKYLDNGTDQGTAWRAPAFNDAAWASGPAQLGYGDGDEATVVSFGPNPGNKHITTYFRHTFSVASPAAIECLLLRVIRDDGIVAYLNGTEVLRNNLPAGTITNQTAAILALIEPGESNLVVAAVDASLLVAGNNVLAVEVHQSSSISTDLSFDLELAGSADGGLACVQRRQWSGLGASPSWSDSGNWTGGSAPLPGDILVFPAGGAQRTNVNDYSLATAFRAIEFTGTGYQLNGNPVVLTGGIDHPLTSFNGTNTMNATLTPILNQNISFLSGGTLNLGGINTGNRTLHWQAGQGTIGGTIIESGVLQVGSPAVLRLSGTNASVGRTIVFGTYILDGTSTGSPILVDTNGTLSGTGLASVVICDGLIWPAQRAPGTLVAAPPSGTLNISKLSLRPSAVVRMQFENSAGSNSRLQIHESASLGGARLQLNSLLTINPVLGQSILLLEQRGTNPINGTFTGLPEGMVTNLPPLAGLQQVSYQAGDGNDLTLTRVAAVIRSATVQPNGTTTFLIQGDPNRTYVVECADDLAPPVQWTPTSTNISGGTGVFLFNNGDTNAINRYYRARLR